MNWRWKRIIICALLGLVMGVLLAYLTLQDLGAERGSIEMAVAVVLGFPISINCLYWGWRKATEVLQSMNLFLIMTIPMWIVYFFIRLFISACIGYIMFPIAVYKAIKSHD